MSAQYGYFRREVLPRIVYVSNCQRHRFIVCVQSEHGTGPSLVEIIHEWLNMPHVKRGLIELFRVRGGIRMLPEGPRLVPARMEALHAGHRR